MNEYENINVGINTLIDRTEKFKNNKDNDNGSIGQTIALPIDHFIAQPIGASIAQSIALPIAIALLK
ncbi:hypothetical protein F5880DRAFT_1616976 [Lentinula raphanica]|nr:hypothetical protein F5880DRAFT_1616976 [Lentinula raphanica]